MIKKSLFILSVLILFFSCSFRDYEKKFIPEKESGIAKDIAEALRQNDFDYIYQNAHPDLLPHLTKESFEEIQKNIPEEKVKSIEVAGSRTNVINGHWTGNFTFEYEFENNKWMLCIVGLDNINEHYYITDLFIQNIPESLLVTNRFTFQNKGFKYYFFFIMMILMTAFSITTLVFCIKTPMKTKKRKVLWCIFVLVGFITFRLNWTTGSWDVVPVSLLLFSAGFLKSGTYAQWIMKFAIPVGAITFWIIKIIKSHIKSHHKEEDPSSVQTES